MSKAFLGFRPQKTLVVGVLLLGFFVGKQGADAAKLQDTLAAIKNGKLILTHQLLAELLIVQAVGNLTPAGFSRVEGVNGLLAQRGGQLL